MKKLFILFFTSLILIGCVGCSNEGKESEAKQVVSTESITLEEQITNIMSEKKLTNKEIIDYDIKDNFVYVIFKNNKENSHNPDLVILENNNGKLKWVAGPDDRTGSVDRTMIFGREKGPSVTITLPFSDTDINIKEVKVLGESAKAVTYLEHITDDFVKEYKYWIVYTNEEPQADDIEIITE